MPLTSWLILAASEGPKEELMRHDVLGSIWCFINGEGVPLSYTTCPGLKGQVLGHQ